MSEAEESKGGNAQNGVGYVSLHLRMEVMHLRIAAISSARLAHSAVYRRTGDPDCKLCHRVAGLWHQ